MDVEGLIMLMTTGVESIGLESLACHLRRPERYWNARLLPFPMVSRPGHPA